MKAGYAIDDSAGLHFIDNKLHKVIAGVENVKVSYFSKENNSLKEQIIKTKYLK